MRFLFRLIFCRHRDDPARVAMIGFAAIVLLVVLHCATAQASRGREPTVHPTFDADCVQGEVCAAPAVVRLDAWATTADGVDRPAHQLGFEWECGNGDPAPAPGPTGACVYEQPGTFTIWLRVERPARGEEPAETAFTSRQVTIRPRSAVRVVELQAGARYPGVALGAGPVLLTTVGNGPPAVVTGQLSPPDGATIAHVDFEGGCISLPPERSRVTLIEVHARACRAEAVVTQTGTGTRHNDRIAVVRSDLDTVGGVAALFARASRLTVLESALESSGYPLRTVHFPDLLFARNRVETSGAGSNALQLRAWGGTGPPNTPSERAVVVENTLLAPSPSTAMIRTCETNTCDSSTPNRADVRDVIVRGNVVRVTGSGSLPPSLLALVEGDGITVEGNTVEAPAANMATPGTVRLVQPFGTGATAEVRDNRMTLPRGTRSAVACDGVGLVCERNEIERTQ